MKLESLIKLDRRKNSSLGMQIFNSIFKAILTKQLPNYYPLPSEKEFAELLNVDLKDIQYAFKLLSLNHYVRKYNEQYIISYIEDSNHLFSKLETLKESIIYNGHTPSYQIISTKKFKADMNFSQRTAFDYNEYILNLRILYLSNDLPVIVVDEFISIDKFPDFKSHFDQHQIIYDVFKKVYHLSLGHADRKIRAVQMDKDIANLLKENEHTTTFLVQSHLFDASNDFIGYAELYTTSHYKFSREISI
jgi:DNA-binding GntR family transcriptional regulator